MTWNYRVIKHDTKQPVYFAVHEVFYDEAGDISSWTAAPIDVTADSKKEIMTTLEQMITDCKTPVLSETELLKLFEADSKIRLVQTCSMCPEQYDAYLEDRQVGYLRLRHGTFRVDYPDAGGETLYEATPDGDGEFFDYEREFYLSEAKRAIAKKLSSIA